jgi:hypothetical protein
MPCIFHLKEKIDTISNWQQEILPHAGTLELLYMLMS